MGFDKPRIVDQNNQQIADSAAERSEAKKVALKRILVLGTILGVALAITTYVFRVLLPAGYLPYLQVAEVVVIGYVVIEIVSSLVSKLALAQSEQTAKSIKSLLRIVGAIIVIAFIISYLSRDPIVAASISTVSGLVIGFSASNLIGNAIAGIYLAIARPFRIGDRIKVFGEIGEVYDIGLLYTRILLPNGDHMLTSNSSMVTTTVILKRGREEATGTDASAT